MLGKDVFDSVILNSSQIKRHIQEIGRWDLHREVGLLFLNMLLIRLSGSTFRVPG
jgi:hypothetical protein